MNMKKTAVLTVLLILLAYPAFCTDGKRAVERHNAQRQAFLEEAPSKTGVDKAALKAAKDAGFSPAMSFMFARLSKVTGIKIAEIIRLHEQGVSWKEICESKGVDYAAFMDETRKLLKEKKVKIPPPAGQEKQRDAQAAMSEEGDGK